MNQFSYEQGRSYLYLTVNKFGASQSRATVTLMILGIQAFLICTLHHSGLSKLSHGPHLLLELQPLSHILANRKENGKEEGRNKGDNFAFKTIPNK